MYSTSHNKLQLVLLQILVYAIKEMLKDRVKSYQSKLVIPQSISQVLVSQTKRISRTVKLECAENTLRTCYVCTHNTYTQTAIKEEK